MVLKTGLRKTVNAVVKEARLLTQMHAGLALEKGHAVRATAKPLVIEDIESTWFAHLISLPGKCRRC